MVWAFLKTGGHKSNKKALSHTMI